MLRYNVVVGNVMLSDSGVVVHWDSDEAYDVVCVCGSDRPLIVVPGVDADAELSV